MTMPMYGICKKMSEGLAGRFYARRLFGVNMAEGMSMIELLVMTAVMVTLTTILVGGLPVFNESIYVKKNAELFALELRNTQSNAILGRTAPGAGLTPLYWGLHAETASPSQFIIFADTNGNHLYDAGGDEVFKTIGLDNGVRITALTSPSGPENALNFFFVVPYGDTDVQNASANVGSWGKITISSTKQDIIRTITMRVSGQIALGTN